MSPSYAVECCRDPEKGVELEKLFELGKCTGRSRRGRTHGEERLIMRLPRVKYVRDVVEGGQLFFDPEANSNKMLHVSMIVASLLPIGRRVVKAGSGTFERAWCLC